MPARATFSRSSTTRSSSGTYCSPVATRSRPSRCTTRIVACGFEQELREAQIRLRRAVTDAFGAREAIAGAVVRKIKQVRAPLHALLALKGIACAPDLPSVIAKVGETYGVDVAPLRAAREAPDTAHGALVALLTKTIDDVNAMETAPAGGAAS